MDRAYAGNKSDFLYDFGGVPGRPTRFNTLILITIAVIVVIIIITCLLLLRARTTEFFTDRNTLYNLDLLVDVNNGQVECCIPPGKTAPTRAYVYDATADITYSRDKPNDIDVVCSSFPNPAACVSENTDGEGNVVPVVTFEALPYFTFEKGQFVGCPNTIVC